jgi:hypothetical protein
MTVILSDSEESASMGKRVEYSPRSLPKLTDSSLSLRMTYSLKLLIMKKNIFLLISLMSFTGVFAQLPQQQGHTTGHNTAADPSSETWKKLRSLKYEEINATYFPKFSEDIKALDGKVVELKGFIIPLQETTTTTYFMLSYFPFSNCYFCGAAGPETVVEVKAAKPVIYTSKPVVLSGKLKLNRSDEEHLFYILEETVQVN